MAPPLDDSDIKLIFVKVEFVTTKSTENPIIAVPPCISFKLSK